MVNLPKSIEKVKKLILPGEECYLVGGAVRDSLLNRSSKDLDIVYSGDTRAVARRLADLTSGVFFMLDEERDTCRVITNDEKGEKISFDFTRLQGGTIESDLHLRDFTINAMAVNIAIPGSVIDPLKGGRDLIEKWLRPCSPTSFQDDPLRVIRAVRYSVLLGLKMESKTIDQLRQAVNFLDRVSNERKRDELFKIFDNGRSSVSVQLLFSFGIFPFCGIYQFSNFERTLLQMRILDSILDYFCADPRSPGREYFLLASLAAKLGKYKKKMQKYLLQQNDSGRTLKSLDLLGMLLYGTQGAEFIDELPLSKEEQTHLFSLLENKKSFHGLGVKKSPVENRTLFHYFRKIRNTGNDLALLSLADTASVVSAEMDQDLWLGELGICDQVFDLWFDHPEVLNPEALLTGTDLMFEFDLKQGPLIGELLEGLREEQAAGMVKTRTEALDWVEGKIHVNVLKSE
ncbi:MAG: hypothetical protein NTZ74_11785 [Chloroflexi bacterium]|nr:hypothetical protein [Chloroflexota bacterium]